MTAEQAKELLLMHSFMHDDIEHPKMTLGFLGSLRPYRGLREENLHEVMESLRVLAPELRQEKVDTEVMSALWGICVSARAWGVHPLGMLRRNHLITGADIERLEAWIGAIEYAVMVLLDGNDPEEAFAGYRQVMARG
jgi:hypothetical protein